MNFWQISTVVLASLVFTLLFTPSNIETYDIDGMKIPKTFVDDVAKLSGDEFTICGIQEDKCVIMMGENKNDVYQGPVPEGYDLEYFRKTGITKKIEE